jgi:hypothetical protein
MSVGLSIDSRNFHLMAIFMLQLGSLCCILLRHIPTIGYDVCGDNMLGMRCRCSLALVEASS